MLIVTMSGFFEKSKSNCWIIFGWFYNTIYTRTIIRWWISWRWTSNCIICHPFIISIPSLASTFIIPMINTSTNIIIWYQFQIIWEYNTANIHFTYIICHYPFGICIFHNQISNCYTSNRVFNWWRWMFSSNWVW